MFGNDKNLSVKRALSSYLTLASVFLVGLLLGAIGMAVWSGDLSNDETSSKNKASTSSMRLKRGGNGSLSKNDVATLSNADIVSRVSQLSARVTTDHELEQLKDMVSRAATFAPEATLDTALQIEDPHKCRDVLERLFNRWVSKDQSAALTALDSIKSISHLSRIGIKHHSQG